MSADAKLARRCMMLLLWPRQMKLPEHGRIDTILSTMEKAEEKTRFEEALEKYAIENKSTTAILYGGDGTLVGEWRKFRSRKSAKIVIIPVRNYGLCQKHLDFYTRFFTAKDTSLELEDVGDLALKQFLFPVLRAEFKDKGMDNYLDALSEVTVVGADQTAALRFNIKLNGKTVVENVIANGAILATKLGSTGYFKSVARTIFTEGIGVGFIAPTYSVPNIVVAQKDKVKFELARKAKIVVTADKLKQEVDADAGWTLEVMDACDNMAVFGYDHFMCPECRKNRNSTIVNDNYCVV